MDKFRTIWRNKWITSEAKTLDDMICELTHAASYLATLKEKGVTLDPDGGTEDDYAILMTTDPEVAKEFEFESEKDFFGEDYDEEDDDEEEDGDEEDDDEEDGEEEEEPKKEK